MIYSISELEQLSGVQTHTIRIWERRYGALRPVRSEGNTRQYDDIDLKRLLNIVGLSQTGMKISRVCSLSEDEMDELLHKEMEQTIPEDTTFEYYVSQLLKHGLSYDEYHFDELISKSVSAYGMLQTYKNVIYPLLVRLGLMWRRDHICPAQEHFISQLIRQKLFTAIDGIPPVKNFSTSWMLFLPEDEDHEIGLLLASYLLRSSGQKVIYLGPKVPMESLEQAMGVHKADHLLFFWVRNRPLSDAAAYMDRLTAVFPDSRIHLAGNHRLMTELKLAGNVDWLSSIADLEGHLKNTADVS